MHAAFPPALPSTGYGRGAAEPATLHRQSGATGGDAAWTPPPTLRDLAQRADFGYPTAGTPAANAFLDQLQAELAPRAARAEPTPEYLEQAAEILVRTYGELLRKGDPAAALAYRRSVKAAFDRRSSDEGRRIDDWFGQVATFLRRAADLMARTVEETTPDTLPFAKVAVERHIDQGLKMLESQSAVPPLVTTVAGVMQEARQELARRLAEIDTFFEKAQAGGSIAGVPCTRHIRTRWLLDGRYIFEDVKAALAMAPRPVADTNAPIPPAGSAMRQEIEYGPQNFHGERPFTIEYADPQVFRGLFLSPYRLIHTLDTDAAPDHDHTKDRYRLHGGSWQHYAQITTPQMEILKCTWYARLHEQARQAIGDDWYPGR